MMRGAFRVVRALLALVYLFFVWVPVALVGVLLGFDFDITRNPEV